MERLYTKKIKKLKEDVQGYWDCPGFCMGTCTGVCSGCEGSCWGVCTSDCGMACGAGLWNPT